MEHLTYVYKKLRGAGFVRSQYQFSREWLERDRSYYSSIKAQGTKPTVATFTNLEAKIGSEYDLIHRSKTVAPSDEDRLDLLADLKRKARSAIEVRLTEKRDLAQGASRTSMPGRAKNGRELGPIR
jgi:hypothetical protein